MPKDPVPRLACLAATRAEIGGPLPGASRMVEGALVMSAGVLHDVEVVLVRTGMGPANSARAVERALEAFNISEVLLIGFAGGTRPGLRTPDLVACSELQNLAGVIGKIASSPALVERAQNTGFISTAAPALTVDRVISSAKEKQELGRKFGAAVVEMEGYPVLREAHRHGLPGLMVRAILDPLEMSLPNAAHLLNESGEPRALNLLAHLAKHPTHVLVLFDLLRRARACRRMLNQFLKSYLNLAPAAAVKGK